MFGEVVGARPGFSNEPEREVTTTWSVGVTKSWTIRSFRLTIPLGYGQLQNERATFTSAHWALNVATRLHYLGMGRFMPLLQPGLYAVAEEGELIEMQFYFYVRAGASLRL